MESKHCVQSSLYTDCAAVGGRSSDDSQRPPCKSTWGDLYQLRQHACKPLCIYVLVDQEDEDHARYRAGNVEGDSPAMKSTRYKQKELSR